MKKVLSILLIITIIFCCSCSSKAEPEIKNEVSNETPSEVLTVLENGLLAAYPDYKIMGTSCSNNHICIYIYNSVIELTSDMNIDDYKEDLVAIYSVFVHTLQTTDFTDYTFDVSLVGDITDKSSTILADCIKGEIK